MSVLLEVESACYAYAADIPALAGISLTVGAGERVVVLGANGCGKTTLLKLLAGLLFAQRGSYRAFGREITEPLLSRDPFGMYFRKEVGVLFQNVDAQLFNPTVEDEIAFGPLQFNDPPDAVRRKVQDGLDRFGLRGLAGRPPFALSGGEKKKVALAAMLAVDPQVLLLDEPTAGLDPRSSRVLVDLILEAQTQGKTIVTSSNDLHIVPEIAGRVVVFGEDRRILASGPPERILQDRALLRAANLIHRHRHAHEGLWHEHEHDHPGVSHGHTHEVSSSDGSRGSTDAAGPITSV
jgi:cobalt/nickel transport system ATP-binding protein